MQSTVPHIFKLNLKMKIYFPGMFEVHSFMHLHFFETLQPIITTAKSANTSKPPKKISSGNPMQQVIKPKPIVTRKPKNPHTPI